MSGQFKKLAKLALLALAGPTWVSGEVARQGEAAADQTSEAVADWADTAAWRLPRASGSVGSPLLRRLAFGPSGGGERRLATNSTNATEEGDPIINAIIGTFTVMGGTRIMPVMLLINGFIAAEVGKAFDALVDDFTPQNIIELFLRALSGCSIGTVGIQNMNFQSTLQGAVLFASLLSSVRQPLEDAIAEGVSGDAEKWLMLALDVAITGLGSGLALAFMALFKVLNSAYLSATMFVLGWIRVIENATGEDTFSSTVETVLTVIVALFCIWWHSLIVSRARADEWSRRFKAPAKFQVKSTVQKVTEMLVLPVSMANKLVCGFSMAVGMSANLKAAPRTMQEILELVADKLGLASVGMIVGKQVVKYQAKGYVNKELAKAGMAEAERKKVADLTGMVCGALTVADMRQVLFDLKETGDFTGVLDSCFEDVVQGLKKQALIEEGKGKKPDFDEDRLSNAWEEAKDSILRAVMEKSKELAKPVVSQYCGLADKAQQQYVEGLVDRLDLQEVTIVLRLVKNGRFSLQDLIDIAESKAPRGRRIGWDDMGDAGKAQTTPGLTGALAQLGQAAIPGQVQLPGVLNPPLPELAAAQAGDAMAQAKTAAEQQAKAAVDGAAAQVQAAAGPDTEVQAGGARALSAEAAHGVRPPDAATAGPGCPGGVAVAALEKSHEKSVYRLAESMCDILKVRAAVESVPVVGKLVSKIEGKVNKLLATTLGVVPFAGPKLVELGVSMQARVKLMMLSKGLTTAFKQSGVPLSMVTDVVQKLASMDEYLDDALESLLNPGAAAAASAGTKAKEPGGLTGLALRQVRERGPGRCREMMIYAMVEIFELDLALSEKFVKSLKPRDLMLLGQEILQGGFPFAACTKLVKMKTEEVALRVPVRYLEDGLGDSQIGINFTSPPCVISVDDEWIAQVVNETQSQAPEKGDKLIFLGKQAAAFMTKEQFEVHLKQMVTSAKQAAAMASDGKEPTVKFVFKRGLDMHFSERFREVLPSVLRKFLGVPFDQGSELARNLTMDHMQKLVFIFLNGGLKQLDDLATELGVEVNFEQSFKAHIPLQLVLRFGFAMRGATRFVASLDPATSPGPMGFLTRIQQMMGMGELEAMSAILCMHDVASLDRLHKRRFNPRVDLSKLLDVNPLKVDGIRVNLVVSGKGQFELWRDGARVGPVHEDTVAIVLGIWREMQETHYDDVSGPVKGVPEWSGEEPVEQLKEASTDHHKMKITKTFFKWPDHVIEKAGLTAADAAVAQRLFFVALEEARESVYDKYERKIMAQAFISFGFEKPKPEQAGGVAKAGTEAADVAALIASSDKGNAEVEAWIQKLYDAFPKPGKGRQQELKLLEKSLQERDTFRLGKLAQKYGVTDPMPLDGLLKKLGADLSGLPIDIGSQADQISAFLTASKHPLTGKTAGYKMPKQAQAGGKTFQTEAAHGAAPAADVGASTSADHPAMDIELGAARPAKLGTVGAHGAEAPAAQAPRLKEIFSLAQKGGFETLSKFAAASAPGGTTEICTQLRATLAKRLPVAFGITERQALAAAERLLPSTHKIVDTVTTCLDEPASPDSIEADERDGDELAPGSRVSVVEEKGGLVRLAKPKRGWLLAAEIRKVEAAPGSEQREMQLASQALRCVKNYAVVELQELGDEHGWDLDFVRLCKQRIVDALRERLDDYQPAAIQRAARQLKDTDTIKACMEALDRRDMGFVVDALALPPPGKRPKQQKPKPKAKPPPKTHREKKLERALRKMQGELDHFKSIAAAWPQWLAPATPTPATPAPPAPTPAAPAPSPSPPSASQVGEEVNEPGTCWWDPERQVATQELRPPGHEHPNLPSQPQ